VRQVAQNAEVLVAVALGECVQRSGEAELIDGLRAQVIDGRSVQAIAATISNRVQEPLLNKLYAQQWPQRLPRRKDFTPELT
jgi:hypothetical protein